MKIHEVVLLAESANTLFAVKVIDPKTGDEKTMEISALTATEAKSKVAGRTVDVDGEKKHYKVISVKSAWNEAKDVGKQLSIEQLATISDAALDSAYGYGRSQPGNTFGWQANLKSAAFAKQMIDKGVTDVEAISDAIHKGWNVTAQAFVKNPQMFDDSKTMAPEKLQAKIAQRQKLMTQQYAQLPEDEKEKDRVVAHAMLQAITGGQQGVEEEKAGLYANTHAKRERIKHGSGEHMRKPGTKGAPTSQSWKDAAKTAKTEAANPAQQAAIAIAKKEEKGVKEGETGPKFTGYWKGKDKGKPGSKMVGDA